MQDHTSFSLTQARTRYSSRGQGQMPFEVSYDWWDPVGLYGVWFGDCRHI